MVEDLRSIPLEILFERLEKGNIRVDKGAFLQYAETCDTPEELADLIVEEDSDALYLILFEIWRRLLPEKQSLSIFFDELDYRISLFDQGKMESDEWIQDGLANLMEILDENADAGVDPQEVFRVICDYCAHDLESFLYDYIADLLDSGNPFYASELVEGFFPYVNEPIWFEFLKARIVAATDIGEADRLIAEILEGKADLPLLIEVLKFLKVNGEPELFIRGVKKVLPLLRTEEELVEVMAAIADYYRRLDQDALEQAIQKLMEKRKEPYGKLDPKDPDLKKLHDIVIK
ncbi:MAG TPA: hypothetical protein VLE89_08965 [Chlamydiales bacterium]|nr:hypothetical protein [Chlamydiales bacterium]